MNAVFASPQYEEAGGLKKLKKCLSRAKKSHSAAIWSYHLPYTVVFLSERCCWIDVDRSMNYCHYQHLAPPWLSISHLRQDFDFWHHSSHIANALCNKSNGRCDIKAEKREELESKSSHKSDIWLPAASKKWGEIYWKYIFQTLEAIFPYKGVFVTKVVKANIIAFIKTKILRPVLSVTNPPFQKCQPLLHSALSLSFIF